MSCQAPIPPPSVDSAFGAIFLKIDMMPPICGHCSGVISLDVVSGSRGCSCLCRVGCRVAVIWHHTQSEGSDRPMAVGMTPNTRPSRLPARAVVKNPENHDTPGSAEARRNPPFRPVLGDGMPKEAGSAPRSPPHPFHKDGPRRIAIRPTTVLVRVRGHPVKDLV